MYRNYEEPIEDEVLRYLAATTPAYIPKTQTSEKNLNDFLEQALKTLDTASSGDVKKLVDNMVSKKGKKRLKKLHEEHSELCQEGIGIGDRDQFSALYYLLVVVVEQVEKHLLPIKSDQ